MSLDEKYVIMQFYLRKKALKGKMCQSAFHMSTHVLNYTKHNIYSLI